MTDDSDTPPDTPESPKPDEVNPVHPPEDVAGTEEEASTSDGIQAGESGAEDTPDADVPQVDSEVAGQQDATPPEASPTVIALPFRPIPTPVSQPPTSPVPPVSAPEPEPNPHPDTIPPDETPAPSEPAAAFSYVENDEDDDEDDATRATAVLQESLARELETLEKAKQKYPDIPILIMFGLAESGKSTMAYRLQRDAENAGRTVRPGVWEDTSGRNKNRAVGTTEIRAHYFGDVAESADQQERLEHQYIIVDFPGEFWRSAVTNGVHTIDDPMLKMISISTGYIFALEANEVFSRFGKKGGVSRAEPVSDQYKSLFRNISDITDLDARLSDSARKNQDFKSAAAMVRDQIRNGAINTVRTPKPIFVAFTKADALAESVIERFLRLCEDSGAEPPKGMKLCWKEYQDWVRSREAVPHAAPTAILSKYHREMAGICQGTPGAMALELAEFLETYQYPIYGALSNAQELVARLSNNSRLIRFDFVSPFDGTNPEQKKDGNLRFETKPNDSLEHFGLVRNVDWLRKTSIDQAKGKSRLRKFGRWFRHMETIRLFDHWIASSRLPNAENLKKGNPKRFRNGLSRIITKQLIGNRECSVPPKASRVLPRLLVLSALPAILCFSGIAIYHSAQPSPPGFEADAEPPRFDLSSADIVTPGLRAALKSQLGSGLLSYDGQTEPWIDIPDSGISKIVDPPNVSGRFDTYCSQSGYLCRSGEKGAVAFLERVRSAGELVGYQAGGSLGPEDPIFEKVRALGTPPSFNTGLNSQNSKAFLPYHWGLIDLWLSNAPSAKTQLSEVIRQIEHETGSYPFRADGAMNLDTGAPETHLLEILVTIVRTDQQTTQEKTLRQNVARVVILHSSALNALGLAQLMEGDSKAAEQSFASAAYLASYQRAPTGATPSNQEAWIGALNNEANDFIPVSWPRIETNRLLARYLDQSRLKAGEKSASVDVALARQAAKDFDTLARMDNAQGTGLAAAHVNSKLLNALIAVNGNTMPESSDAADSRFTREQDFPQGPAGVRLASNDALASLLLGQEVSEFGKAALEETKGNDLQSRFLMTALAVRDVVNANQDGAVGEDLWSSIVDQHLGTLTPDEQEAAGRFRARLRRQVGAALVQQAAQAYQSNGTESRLDLIDTLIRDAKWLSVEQKISLRTFPVLGLGALPVLALLLACLAFGVCLFVYFNNLWTSFRATFESSHLSEAEQSRFFRARRGFA